MVTQAGSPVAPPPAAGSGSLARRLLSIPALLLATLVFSVLAPLLLIIALALCWLPALAGAPRTLGFLVWYLWCETLGVLASTGLWLWAKLRRWPATAPANLAAHYALQHWWVRRLFGGARRLFGFRLHISGTDALPGPAPILLSRHASLADTLLPFVTYALPQHKRLAYVMKRELLWEPCLDIVGQRLPNCFVDRDAEDGSREAGLIARLLQQLAADTTLVIFPEGTRFSPARQQRALTRLADKVPAALLMRMQGWTHLLPPRLGGPLALLAANAAGIGRDLLFCAHQGLEEASHFRSLLRGSLIGQKVSIHFWRIPFAQIPKDEDGQRALLLAQWDEMQAQVQALATTGRPVSAPR